MKVIRHGRFYTVDRRQCECGCIFEFTNRDKRKSERHEGHDAVLCPECGAEITMGETK